MNFAEAQRSRGDPDSRQLRPSNHWPFLQQRHTAASARHCPTETVVLVSDCLDPSRAIFDRPGGNLPGKSFWLSVRLRRSIFSRLCRGGLLAFFPVLHNGEWGIFWVLLRSRLPCDPMDADTVPELTIKVGEPTGHDDHSSKQVTYGTRDEVQAKYLANPSRTFHLVVFFQ